MTQTRWLGAMAIAVGVALLILAVFAHRLGLSALPTFGWKKLLAAVSGGLAIAAGLGLVRVRAADDEVDESPEQGKAGEG